MRHRAISDRLSGFIPGVLYAFFDQGELALCQARQRPSVELVALPLLRLPTNQHHEVKRLLLVLLSFFYLATQRVDTRAQRDIKSGASDAFARVAPLQIAPFTFDRQDFIPTVQPEQALRQQAERAGLLEKQLCAPRQVFCFFN